MLFCLYFSMSTKQNAILSYLQNTGSQRLIYRTVGEQLQITSEKYGNRDAIVAYEDNKRYNFAEAHDKVC